MTAPPQTTVAASPATPGRSDASWPQRNWPYPAAPPRWPVLAAIAATSLVAALTYLGQPPGAQVTAVVWLSATAIVMGHLTAGRRRALTRPSTVLMGMSTLALGVVPSIRDAPWLIALCLTAATGLGILIAVEGRTWSSGALASSALLVASVRSVPWVGAGVRAGRQATRGRGVVRGVVIGLALLWALAALLASADAVFEQIVGAALPDITAQSLFARVVVGLAVALTVAGAAFAATSPPHWDRLVVARGRGPVAEWAVPLALVAILLAGFGAVQVVALVDPALGLSGTGLAPAERARQGFGQLVAVTVVATALLAWTGRRAAPDNAMHRQLLGGLGGVVSVGVLGVVATALHRMWSYEEAFGWTVMRLLVAVFEGWLGIVVVLVGLAWAARRLHALPRAAVATAALTLVALAAINPEGWLAARNIDRFEQGAAIDTRYLAGLSDDAVPAIAELPPRLRRCALGLREVSDAAWYAANLGRHHAQPILRDHPVTRPGEISCP